MSSQPVSVPASAQAHFLNIKKEIASTYPDFQERVTRAWGEILVELAKKTDEISKSGPEYIPQVNFSELDNLSPEVINELRRKGSVVIKDVVDDEQAVAWRRSLVEFVKTNPDVEGVPENDKQFFMLYWTKAQVQARAHPNMLKATAWLNNLYHSASDQIDEGVDLNVPLSYADRFRMRHPGVAWDLHPPHVDGGSIERWEDAQFRTCFKEILSGDWRKHDAYDLSGRLKARSSLYKRPGQATIFRTFQGWLALSETGPSRGTLKVFPDVLLSNAYTILRPFMKPLVSADSKEIWDAKNWEYDISSSEFPGIVPRDNGFMGPRPTPAQHPNLRLEETMTSVPAVKPGDTVFWHCDVVHSVEIEHTGSEDSAVMYIPAVPLTPMNQAYIEKQKESFLRGVRPPDFPQGVNEDKWVGVGSVDDITSPIGQRAMGFLRIRAFLLVYKSCLLFCVQRYRIVIAPNNDIQMSARALNAILPQIATSPYEAHQKARTFAARYIKSGQYDTAIDVLFQSARELLKTGQNGSGVDLASFMLEVYDTKPELISDESKGRLTQLIALTSSADSWRKTVVDKSIAWSAKHGPCPAGDQDLHHYVGELFYKEGSFEAAEPHFLASGKRDSARLLADMFIQWSNGSSPGPFAIRGTLPYLQNGNILAARTFITHFVSSLPGSLHLKSSPISVGSTEVILTSDSLVNFAQLAVLTCQRAQGEKNKAMRESWVRLCGTYQSHGGPLAEPDIRKVLNEIATLYFAIPPPRGQAANPLGDMLSSLFGGPASSGAPARRTLQPAGSTPVGLD